MPSQTESITAEELIAYIKRTDLKNKTWLLVEDKVSISSKEPYRFIRDQLGSNFEIHSCMGKTTLMRIFEKRSELSGVNLVFYRDRDFYVHNSIPKEYEEIVFTTGYSIENDLCAQTSIVEKLLLPEEKQSYKKAVSNFVYWYSVKVNSHLKGFPSNYDTSPFSILTSDYEIKPEYLPTEEERISAQSIYDEIHNDYSLKLRGHSLFALFVLFLNRTDRTIKMNYQEIAKYCVAELSPPLLMRTINEIEARHR